MNSLDTLSEAPLSTLPSTTASTQSADFAASGDSTATAQGDLVNLSLQGQFGFVVGIVNKRTKEVVVL